MHAEVSIPVSLLISFVLVLARIAGVFIFVPLPGVKSGFEMPRIVISVATTIALFPRWPSINPDQLGIVHLSGLLILEAGLGLAAGIAIGYVSEAFMMGAQILAMQAGFGYASMVDPNTQAESGVLPMLAQFFAGLLFFTTGLDRQVLFAFARSIEVLPPGSFLVTRPMAEQLFRLGGSMFSVGLRLILPVLALLLMVDLSLALLGRLNAQLQMITMLFPAKILTTFALLSWTVILFPKVFSQTAGQMMGFVNSLLVR